jgi:hypothetical protein
MPLIAAHLVRPGQPPAEVQADHWLVVISQTCDVVQRKLESEPFLEVLHCRPEPHLRGEFQGRKSTRRLDFRPNKATHADLVLSAHAIADRHVVPRDLFVGHTPDGDRRLSAATVTNLQLWYALRYARPAWPDAFNSRFDKKTKKKLADALKILTVDDVEVRIAIVEREHDLSTEEPYHVALFYVVDQQFWDNEPEIREQAHKSFAEFSSVLAGCNGIAVNEELSGVKSGDEFSWQMTRTTDEWNFANLSELE